MAAEDLALSDDLDAEFNPQIMILANDPDGYLKFAELLQKNGFVCNLYAMLPESAIVNPRAGTIFFISFNLKATDPIAAVKFIEQKHNMACIVFAEQSGFETAAKLSSARMSQTLQHPYTEKNFLMAVQTIVKKRKVQHQKNLRKNSFVERRKGIADSAANDSGRRVVRSNAWNSGPTDTIVIQKGGRQLGPATSLIKGNRLKKAPTVTADRIKRSSFFAVQKGFAGAKFMEMQKSGARPRAPYLPKAKARAANVNIVRSERPAEASKLARGQSQSTEADAVSESTPKRSPMEMKQAGTAKAAGAIHQSGPKAEPHEALGKDPAAKAGAAARGETQDQRNNASQHGASSRASQTKAPPQSKGAEDSAKADSLRPAQKSDDVSRAKSESEQQKKPGNLYQVPKNEKQQTAAVKKSGDQDEDHGDEREPRDDLRKSLRKEDLDESSAAEENEVPGHATELSRDLAETATVKTVADVTTPLPEPLEEAELLPEPTEPEEPTEPAEPAQVTRLTENFVVPTWVLIAGCAVGILLCLYFIYQILFN